MKKTKALLIFPPFTVSSSDYPTPDLPLGLAYLASVLEKNKYPVKILDALALGIEQARKKKGGLLKVGLSPREIKKVVADYQPDVIGVSCAYTSHAPDSHEIAALVKEVKPKILGNINFPVRIQANIISSSCPFAQKNQPAWN